MSWENILKGKRMNSKAKQALIDLMADREKRTVEGILDEMWNKIEQGPSGRHRTIPTNSEIRGFFSNSQNYESGIFDTITGTQLKLKTKPYHKRYYWRV